MDFPRSSIFPSFQIPLFNVHTFPWLCESNHTVIPSGRRIFFDVFGGSFGWIFLAEIWNVFIWYRVWKRKIIRYSLIPFFTSPPFSSHLFLPLSLVIMLPLLLFVLLHFLFFSFFFFSLSFSSSSHFFFPFSFPFSFSFFFFFPSPSPCPPSFLFLLLLVLPLLLLSPLLLSLLL